MWIRSKALNLYYNIDVIQRRFLFCHACSISRWSTGKTAGKHFEKNKHILEKIIIKLPKKASYYLNGDRKHRQLGEGNRFRTYNCAGLWCGRSVSAFSQQAKQRLYSINETFRLFFHRRNAYNFSQKNSVKSHRTTNRSVTTFQWRWTTWNTESKHKPFSQTVNRKHNPEAHPVTYINLKPLYVKKNYI